MFPPSFLPSNSRMPVVHEAGGLVATAILFQNSERLGTPGDGVYDLVDPIAEQSFRSLGWTDEALDFSNYHAALLTLTDHEEVVSESTRAVDQPLVDYLAALRGGTESRRDAVETCYWQPWVQSPKELTTFVTSQPCGITWRTTMMTP